MVLERSRKVRYSLAIASVLAATFVRLPFNQLLNDRLLFAAAFCAVLASAWFGGRGPGLFSVALGALITWLAIVPPQGTFFGKAPASQFQIVIFLIVSALIALFCGSLRLAIDALEDREAQLKFMTAAMPEILFTADAKGQIETLSKRFQEYSGQTLAEVGAAGWMHLVETDSLHSVLAAWKTAIDHESEFLAICRLRNKDAEYRWFQCRAVPMRDKRRAVVRWFGVCTDINDLKRLEQALAEQSKALARSNEDLQRFAFAVSHDLQEPLRMIGIFTELLVRDQPYKAESGYLISQIQRGVNRMDDLIQTCLEYSRIRSDDAQIDKPVSLEEPLAEALWGLQAAMQQTNAAIQHDPLPDVIADPRLISRVFQNLIGNALKFRSDQPPLIKISASLRDGMYVISVSDNGIGMSMDHAKSIFDAFHRLHPRDQYPGSGLGLASVKRIIEIHRGQVWVESRLGQGSTFFFTLPAAPN